MKSLLPLLLFTPLAMAHEGHGGIGLYHHFMDALPALALIAVVAGVWWVKRHK
ncbi:hypothetical protein KJI95_01090 [Shewanella sp. JM162201]|uniref:HupE / UreJ protein n=1 Tax=Shewanella jiangmenensis TaxID=2837387 RepID=A0ABS5UYD0_9GAMM|nr:hypothetical protein [Shewanella jiangmenensis]MBT1443124.1 hypothetical protein [Shewanella jiangmenensis]